MSFREALLQIVKRNLRAIPHPLVLDRSARTRRARLAERSTGLITKAARRADSVRCGARLRSCSISAPHPSGIAPHIKTEIRAPLPTESAPHLDGNTHLMIDEFRTDNGAAAARWRRVARAGSTVLFGTGMDATEPFRLGGLFKGLLSDAT